MRWAVVLSFLIIAAAMSTDPAVLGKYIAGYNECTSEVTKYLQTVEGLSSDVRARMLSHLASCLQHTSTSVISNGGATQSPSSLQLTLNQSQPMAIQIPSATSLSALPGTSTAGLCVLNPGTLPGSAMQLVPARLSNGNTVYLLANPQTLTVAGNSNINTVTMATIPQTMKPLSLAIPPTVISPSMASTLTSPQSPVSPVIPVQVIAPAASTSVDACAEPQPSVSAISPPDLHRDCENCAEVKSAAECTKPWPNDASNRPEETNDGDSKHQDVNNNDNNEQNRQGENADQTMWRPW